MKELPLTQVRILGAIIGLFLLQFKNFYIKIIGLSYFIVDTFAIINNKKITKNMRIIFNTLVVISVLFLINFPEIKKNKLIYFALIFMLIYDLYLLLLLSFKII